MDGQGANAWVQQSEDGRSSREALSDRTLIRGRVVYSSPDGPAAPSVRVALLGTPPPLEPEEAFVHAEATTDSNGAFELPCPREGDFSVSCDLPDWKANEGVVSRTESLLIVLQPKWIETSIHGELLGPEDAPVTDFWVSVSGRGVRGRAPERIVSSDGRFQVHFSQSTPTTQLALSIDAPGFRRTAAEVTTLSGRSHDVGTFRVEAFTQRVRGVVLDRASGAPVPDAVVTPVGFVRLASGHEGWGHESDLRTDEHGRFRIDSIRGEGVVALQVTANGFAPKLVIWEDVDEPQGEAVIELERGSSLHGRILGPNGDPLEGLTVRLSSKALENPSRVFHPLWQEFSETDETGKFDFPKLAGGEYSVALLTRYCDGKGTATSRARSLTHPATGDSYIEVISADGGSISVPIDWSESGSKPQSIQGRLIDISGQTVASTLCWRSECSLEFPDVAPGNYDVVLFADASWEPEFRTSVYVGRERITLSPVKASSL